MSDALRGELPSLRVIAALLLINPDDPADPDDLEAAAMLLARRVLREIDDALDGGDPLPRRPLPVRCPAIRCVVPRPRK
jgi:hypothetical protein